MAYVITEECILCDSCVPECPNEAITAGDDIYTIDSSICTECVGFFNEPQCASVCPVECCVPDPEFDEDEEALLARAVMLHPDNPFDTSNLQSRFRN